MREGMGGFYRRNLRAVVGTSAAPYGYTLATWTSGAMLIGARGLPSTVAALAFMFGAVLGFAAVGAAAFGGIRRHFDAGPGEARLIWGSFHFFSVGAAVVAAALVAHHVVSSAAWPLGGFLSTVSYLLVLGAESTVAYGWDHRRRGG